MRAGDGDRGDDGCGRMARLGGVEDPQRRTGRPTTHASGRAKTDLMAGRPAGEGWDPPSRSRQPRHRRHAQAPDDTTIDLDIADLSTKDSLACDVE